MRPVFLSVSHAISHISTHPGNWFPKERTTLDLKQQWQRTICVRCASSSAASTLLRWILSHISLYRSFFSFSFSGAGNGKARTTRIRRRIIWLSQYRLNLSVKSWVNTTFPHRECSSLSATYQS